MAQKKPSQRRKLANLLSGPVADKTMTIGQALLDCGYTELQARKGISSVPDAVWRLLPRNAQKIAKLGRVSPEMQQDLVRGRLVENTIRGKDSGSMSAKILGSDKRVNMWTPEQRNNVLILQAPNHVDVDKMLKEGDG